MFYHSGAGRQYWLITAVHLGLFVCTGIVLALAWRRSAGINLGQPRPATWRQVIARVALIFLIVSYIWLGLGLCRSEFFLLDRGEFAPAAIEWNLLLALGVLIVSAAIPRPSRPPLLAAAFLVWVCWLYIGLIYAT